MTALAASRRATCSAVRLHPTAPRLSRNCSSLRAPITTVVTDGRAQQPVDGDLWDATPNLFGQYAQGIDNTIESLLVDRRRVGCRLVQAAGGGQRHAALDLTGQPAPAEWAPHDSTDLLVEPQRHEFPFIVAPDQRVVDLMRNVARQAEAVGGSQRLHQFPARSRRHRYRRLAAWSWLPPAHRWGDARWLLPAPSRQGRPSSCRQYRKESVRH